MQRGPKFQSLWLLLNFRIGAKGTAWCGMASRRRSWRRGGGASWLPGTCSQVRCMHLCHTPRPAPFDNNQVLYKSHELPAMSWGWRMQPVEAYTGTRTVCCCHSPPGATDTRAGCCALSCQPHRSLYWAHTTSPLVLLYTPGETVLRVPEQLLITTRSARRSPPIAAALHALPGRCVVPNPVAQPADSRRFLPKAAI